MTTVKDEIVSRSPLRILEKSISGGLGRGRVGVLASPKGVGKTACLVHIAADQLFQKRPVIHVSYASRVDHIVGWYEDVFRELAKQPRLKAALELHDEAVRHRVIMNFRQDGTRTEQVLKSLEALIRDGGFAAETLIVDGYDFAQGGPEDFARFREFAGRLGLEVWFSASLRGEEPLYDEQGVPFALRGHLGSIDVLISLVHHGDHVHFNLVKDHERMAPKDLRLKLDPTTLLIQREKK